LYYKSWPEQLSNKKKEMASKLEEVKLFLYAEGTSLYILNLTGSIKKATAKN
jgi:hypothetical protein